MRLELRQIAGTEIGAKWFFERGRRTLGRSPDCDWQLADPERLVSKIHCIIERDRNGFLLRDQSANGSRVDGVIVPEGETKRLADKSRIEIGGLAFIAVVTGEADREIGDPEAGLALSDETLTISSILADVAPGGHTATGILGERNGDNWSNGSADWRRIDAATKSIRDVEIGWDGPPDTSGIEPVLPNDWNADFDYGSQLEHGAATRVSVPVARSRNTVEVDGGTKTIVAANDADFADRPPQSRRSGDAESYILRLETMVDRLEQALADGLSIFEIDTLPAEDETGLFERSHEERLIARLGALLSQQAQFNAALENLADQAGQALEPRMIEARVDAASRKLPWQGSHRYWQAYRAQFEKDGRHLSIRELFGEAMRAGIAGKSRLQTA
ncbi:FHA domain-containing protein [Rhizobium sp. CNPSo 3464]|uniref:FHA domain-containing protein n=1 Tax=Rhizobium sp. CNPSo 3464 TaxID=3021406 RepID=UPI00254DED0B|nr:FHA domain-containing protein [Rhizobium sp. CNPSo 3464]MDK4741183.1 FHA domain-containing protein [Rhizobium sp. CNPSo 3464]